MTYTYKDLIFSTKKKFVAHLWEITGGLTTTGKMPCRSFDIPASRCKVGQKMRNVKGSICSVCYALKGAYMFPDSKRKNEERYQKIFHPEWVDAMVALIPAVEKSGFFRFHSSGDLQGVWHLEKIVEIAIRLPEIKFWLPTREYNIVAEYLRQNQPKSWGGAMLRPNGFPRNLTVRLSGLMLDGKAPNERQNPFGLPTSGAVAVGYNCPADKQGNKCLDCRLCWDSTVHVNYKKH